MFDRVWEGDQNADRPLDVVFLCGCEGCVTVTRVRENGAGQVAVRAVNGAETIATVPEAVVRGLVAEDENEADDDGEGGDLRIGREG